MKRTAIILAIVALTAGCSSMRVDPDIAKHYDTVASVAASKADAEKSRALALTSIANSGDDRVKDRAVAELSKGVDISTQVAQYQKPPNGFLQFLGIVANPLTTLAVGGINAATQIEMGKQAVQSQAITMGTLGGIAQGGYNLGATGIQSATTLGQAGIAKIPSITVGPLMQAPAAAPVAGPSE